MVNGSPVPETEATIPAVTSGLYYGAGCFETFVVENSSIFKFKEHIDRLNRGLIYLGNRDSVLVKDEIILEQINTLLIKNKHTDKRVRVRIQVSMAEKGGYSATKNTTFLKLITSHLADKQRYSKKLIQAKTTVVPSSSKPSDLKLSNMLHYREAFREAQKRKADDAVMLTVDGYVAETSIANIFWVKDDNVFTPSRNCDILPGIMRNSVLDLLRNEISYEVIEDKFRMDDLLKADAVWLTNSVTEMIAVSTIENLFFDQAHPILLAIRSKLDAYRQRNKRFLNDV